MEWLIVTEFIPGVGIGPDGTPFLCPGCWAQDTGREVPEGRDLVAWFASALCILTGRGYPLRGMEPEQLAKDYAEEPWHDS